MKMTVLYVKDTGHVMAAVVRAAPVGFPEPDKKSHDPPPEVTALVGSGMPVRGFFDTNSNAIDLSEFVIPAGDLVALAVDRDEGQLLAPRGYAVLDNKSLEIPPAVGGLTLTTPDAGTLTLSLPGPVPAVTAVRAYLVPRAGTNPATQRFDGQFEPTTGATPSKVSFGVRAPLDGDYDVLMLVRGFRAAKQLLQV